MFSHSLSPSSSSSHRSKFIITKKPLGAPTSERAVPVAIFSAEAEARSREAA